MLLAHKRERIEAAAAVVVFQTERFVLVAVGGRFVLVQQRVGRAEGVVLIIGRLSAVELTDEIAVLFQRRRVQRLCLAAVVGLLQQPVEVVDVLPRFAAPLLLDALAQGVVLERNAAAGRLGLGQVILFVPRVIGDRCRRVFLRAVAVRIVRIVGNARRPFLGEQLVGPVVKVCRKRSGVLLDQPVAERVVRVSRVVAASAAALFTNQLLRRVVRPGRTIAAQLFGRTAVARGVVGIRKHVHRAAVAAQVVQARQVPACVVRVEAFRPVACHTPRQAPDDVVADRGLLVLGIDKLRELSQRIVRVGERATVGVLGRCPAPDRIVRIGDPLSAWDYALDHRVAVVVDAAGSAGAVVNGGKIADRVVSVSVAPSAGVFFRHQAAHGIVRGRDTLSAGIDLQRLVPNRVITERDPPSQGIHFGDSPLFGIVDRRRRLAQRVLRLPAEAQKVKSQDLTPTPAPLNLRQCLSS